MECCGNQSYPGLLSTSGQNWKPWITKLGMVVNNDHSQSISIQNMLAVQTFECTIVIFPKTLLNQVRRVTFVKMQLLLPQYVAPNRPRQWSLGRGHFLFLFEQRGTLTFMPCLAGIICVHCQSFCKELIRKRLATHSLLLLF